MMTDKHMLMNLFVDRDSFFGKSDLVVIGKTFSFSFLFSRFSNN